MNLFTCILAFVAVAAADNLEDTFSAINDQFTARMFQEVVKSNPGKSVVISAASVMSPLAQLAGGARGPSYDQIMKVLGLKSYEEAKQVFSNLNKKLRGSGANDVDLRLANKLYVRKGAELNTTFAEVSRNYFDSDVQNIDFTKSHDAAKQINDWVESKTNNRIKDLVSENQLDATTSVVLVNAIYFKGQWKRNFTKTPYDIDFHMTTDKSVKIPFMTVVDYVPYTESEELDAQIIQVGYQGDRSSLLLVLPKTVDGLAGLVEKLKDPTALNKALNKMEQNEVEILLPKFKIETTTDLKTVLQKMDIKSVFSPSEAHLDYLLNSNESLYISDAKQKAFIEVNEEGTEAAVANEVIAIGIAPAPHRRGSFGSLPPKRPYFKADNPFIFYFRDQTNRTVFSGVFPN